MIAFNRFIADSYLYLPLAGLCLAGAGAIAPQFDRVRLPTSLGVAAVLGVYIWLCPQQIARWQSHEQLWQPVAQMWPDQAWPWLMLAQGYSFEERYPQSVQAYQQAFARTYQPQHLGSFAVALVQAEDWTQAECIMVEALHFGAKPEQAHHNLALFLITHPDYTPRNTSAAHRALRWAARARDAGTLRWPPAWLETIAPRQTELQPSLPPPLDPKKQACPIFQRTHPDALDAHH